MFYIELLCPDAKGHGEEGMVAELLATLTM